MKLAELRDIIYDELMRAGVPSSVDLTPYWSVFNRGGVPVHLVEGQGGVIALAHRATSESSFSFPMSSAHEQAYFNDLAGRLRSYGDLIERNVRQCPSYAKPGLDLETAREMASEAVLSSFSAPDVAESYQRVQRRLVRDQDIPAPELRPSYH